MSKLIKVTITCIIEWLYIVRSIEEFNQKHKQSFKWHKFKKIIKKNIFLWDQHEFEKHIKNRRELKEGEHFFAYR